jgi:hypothetical protein
MSSYCTFDEFWDRSGSKKGKIMENFSEQVVIQRMRTAWVPYVSGTLISTIAKRDYLGDSGTDFDESEELIMSFGSNITSSDLGKSVVWIRTNGENEQKQKNRARKHTAMQKHLLGELDGDVVREELAELSQPREAIPSPPEKASPQWLPSISKLMDGLYIVPANVLKPLRAGLTIRSLDQIKAVISAEVAILGPH